METSFGMAIGGALRYFSVAAFSVCLCWFGWTQIGKWVVFANSANTLDYIQQTRENCAFANDGAMEGKILSDRATLGYLCRIDTSFLYSPYGKGFFSKSSVEDVIKKMKEEKIKSVMLQENVKGWWDLTTFYHALEKQVSQGDMTKIATKNWLVYRYK